MYIIEKAADVFHNNASTAACGDDIMLVSLQSGIPKERLFELYAQTGLKINMAKTTVGPVGEFLRQTYSGRGVFGYPALGLGAVCYASPWLERFQLESEQAISHTWLTFYSRLLPHAVTPVALTSFIRAAIITDVRQSSHLKGDLRGWLSTPISAGGGGPIEWSDMRRWTTIVHEKSEATVGEFFYRQFGIIPLQRSVAITGVKKLKKLDYRLIMSSFRSMQSERMEAHPMPPKEVKKTETIVRWYFDKEYTTAHMFKLLKLDLPRAVRHYNRRDVLTYVLGLSTEYSGITSVQTTLASTGLYTKTVKAVSRIAASNRKYAGIHNINAVATVYATFTLQNAWFISGTW